MQNNITTFDKNSFVPYSIGFDDLFQKLFDVGTNSSGYPPYNINRLDDNNYLIEICWSAEFEIIWDGIRQSVHAVTGAGAAAGRRELRHA